MIYLFALDHIVIATIDPQKSAEAFSKKYQVTSMPGGKHENWGTYNYLAYFKNNCYIEWLGIYDTDKAKVATNPLVTQLMKTLEKHDELPYQIALRTTILHEHDEHLTKHNIPTVGPLDGSRRKPNGDLLTWSMLFPKAEDDSFHPFIMQWGNTINLPDQKDQINNQEITSVILPKNLQQALADIYRLTSENDSIPLENCKLTFADIFNQVQFKMD